MLPGGNGKEQEGLMRRTWCVCALALALMCLGCGETYRQLFHRYESQFAQKRQQFKQIAQILPAPGSLKEPTAAKLSPPPLYNAKTKSYNTEILMYEQLLDPDTRPQFDLILSGDLLTCILWTGPKNPLFSPDDKAGDTEQMLKKALAYRYLVVLRTVSYVPPVAVNETTCKGGVADLEGFVVDMNSNKVEASFRLTARAASQGKYSYKQYENAADQLEKAVYSSLYTDARQKVGSLLEQTTGGQFVVEE
jgi:hypothetical protein